MGSILLAMIGLPLVGSILNGLIIRTPHPKRAGVIATLFAGASFVMAFSLWSGLHGWPIAISWQWFSAGTTKINMGFMFDSFTASMALIVTGIGTLIHLYSIGYMSHEPTPSRYFAYLNLFLFNMLILICGDSLPVMFVGWEGVGLCSYLLIGYWYQDPEKAAAGMKAFLVNRIGDAGFLLAIFCCFYFWDTAEFGALKDIILKNASTNTFAIEAVAFCLLVGATGKSAQIPLYIWLPDAMAGPTPVSALIHAATMVTAGIYLVCRMNFLFTLAEHASVIMSFIGAATALLAALIAVSQRDIKKVLAYSTVSQLGLMFMALGVHQYFAAFFHVVTHAFFKALLFLGAGSVIHALEGEQDIYAMGGLKSKIPWTHATFAIGTIAIAGIPPLAGFFSKDLILYGAISAHHYGTLLWVIGSFASLLTAFYMTRLYSLTFLGDYRGHAHPHESSWVMLFPLVVLAFGSVVTGFLGVPGEWHLIPNILGEFISNVVPMTEIEHGPLSEMAAMLIATCLAIVGVSVGYLLYRRGPEKGQAIAKAVAPIHHLMMHKFYVDELYGVLFVTPFRWISYFLAKFIDVKVIDGLVLLPSRVCRAGGTLLSFVQWGAAQFYLLLMLLGSLLLMWVALRGVVI